MSQKYDTDPNLVEDCLTGKQGAWDALVDRYSRLIYSILRRYGMDNADADDVFQDVFTILIQNLEKLRDKTRLSAWLITTTHRECWRHGKRKPSHLELDERDIRADEPPVFLTEQWETQNMVRESLEKLGDPCKSLLEAMFLSSSDMDYETIADQLGMKTGSIGPTRARCFQKMESILKDMGFDTLEA